jgi:hypothetical protein
MVPFRWLQILKMRTALALAIAAAVIALPHAAGAVTVDDVMKKMSRDERSGFLSGLVVMLAYQTSAAGDRDKGNCISDAFYGAKKNISWARAYEIFDKYPDKRPEVLLSVLANQLCKK